MTSQPPDLMAALRKSVDDHKAKYPREKRCDRCDLVVSQCTCARQAAADRDQKATAEHYVRLGYTSGSGVSISAHPGICPGCGDYFPAGTPIRVLEPGVRRGSDPVEPPQWGHANPGECS